MEEHQQIIEPQLDAFRSAGALAPPVTVPADASAQTSSEELVHDLGAGGDHRPQFPAVDDLGGAGRGVPGQAGDLLDADPAVAHQADEGDAQLVPAGKPCGASSRFVESGIFSPWTVQLRV